MTDLDQIRVLYAIDSLAPGGAETSLAVLAPSLVDQGVEMVVAPLLQRDGVEGRLRDAGASVIAAPEATGRISAVRHLRQCIRRLQPDLVHTTLYEADLAGRIAARSMSVPVTSSLVSASYGPRHRATPGVALRRLIAAQGVDALSARFVHRFHTVSDEVARAMSQRLLIPRSKMVTIPRARDPEALGRRSDSRRTSQRVSLGIDDELVILAAGRHEYQKGFDVLLAALTQFQPLTRPVTVLLAGQEGGLTSQLRVQSTKTTADVRFLGHRRDLPDLMCAADLLVVPSRWEGLPGIVLEAMALELPILASDLATVREALGTDPPAVLVQPEDPWALRQAIDSWDPSTRQLGTKRSRERFLDNFTPERVAGRLHRFFLDAL